jgi:indole-3-glycerol phosphate synthase
MSVLSEILTNKRVEIAARKAIRPLAELRGEAVSLARPDFVSSLRGRSMSLIAEVKHKSPSAGVIRFPFDPAAIARDYAAAGAQALSVLVDERYFGGGESALRAVRGAIGLPLLYKEFVVDEWQVWHAAACGASAVLLIVAALSREELGRLLDACDAAQVEPLVEVHDEAEADLAVACGARVIGVNNRDLKTLRTSLETTHRLRPRIPADRVLVGESGIRTAEDVLKLKAAGAQAVLVGEHLLRQPDLVKAVRDLMSPAWRP